MENIKIITDETGKKFATFARSPGKFSDTNLSSYETKRAERVESYKTKCAARVEAWKTRRSGK